MDKKRNDKLANNSLTKRLPSFHVLALLNSAPEAIIISRKAGEEIIFVNEKAQVLFGYNQTELLGKSIEILIPKRLQKIHAQFRKQYHDHPSPLHLNERSNLLGCRKDQTEFPAKIMLGPLEIDNDLFIIAIIQDITKQIEIEKQAKLFSTLLNQTSDAIEIVDPETGKFLASNEAAFRTLGYTQEEFLRMSIFDVDPGLDSKAFKKNIQQLKKKQSIIFKTIHKRKDGSLLPVEINIKYVKLDKDYLVSVVRDITKLVRVEKRLQHRALHDRLTNLPNQQMLRVWLEETIKHKNKKTQKFALLQMDIVGFREINNTIGHSLGDSLLQKFAARIKKTLVTAATLFRTGDNEFSILFNKAGVKDAECLIDNLLKMMEKPFTIANIPVHIEIKTGIIAYPTHGLTTDLLFKNASIALNAAKHNGAYVIYDEQYNQYHPDNLALMGELRYAIDNNELMMFYQPKIHVKTGQVIGLEALIRWQNPKRGLILPNQFIPLTEQTGLITPLTLWTFKEVIRQSNLWQTQGITLPISVNLSNKNFLDKKFPKQLERLVQNVTGPLKNLEIEITETTIMANPARAIKIINQLKRLGIQFSIDDFGKGYSSLSYLQKLPVDSLKIDQTFVMNMLHNKNNAIIVKSIIHLAHSLGLSVIAEGVENHDVLQQLKQFECDYAQGYLIAKPLPADKIYDWLMAPTNF